MLIDFIEQQKKAEGHISILDDQLKTIAERFAQIVDDKSIRITIAKEEAMQACVEALAETLKQIEGSDKR